MDEGKFKVGTFGYYWMNTWVWANVIQLGTQEFCQRFLNLKNDPCGRMYDQMTQAARSGVANIAEGNSRHSTSRETEMKLTDVARASLAELSGDYFNWLLINSKVPWSHETFDYKRVNSLQLDKITYTSDVQYLSGMHILAQKQKFDVWLKSNDSTMAANCLLILCNRLIMMINKHLIKLHDDFLKEGGFTEMLTAERLSAKAEQSVVEGSPSCPNCGKPMIRKVAWKGINSGKPFWGCSDYPNCMGTRKFE